MKPLKYVVLTRVKMPPRMPAQMPPQIASASNFCILDLKEESSTL